MYNGFKPRNWYSFEEVDIRERLDKEDLMPILYVCYGNKTEDIMSEIEKRLDKIGTDLSNYMSVSDFNDYILYRYSEQIYLSDSVTTYLYLNLPKDFVGFCVNCRHIITNKNRHKKDTFICENCKYENPESEMLIE